MRAVVLLLVAALVSCRSATEPVAELSATVVRQDVTLNDDGSVRRIDVTLQLSIDNRTSGPVYYYGCGISLEQQDVARRWEYAWSPLCTLTGPANTTTDGMLMIPAGESREVSVHLLGSGESGSEGWASDGLDGTYRLRVSIVTTLPDFWRKATGVELTSQLLTTNEFSLEQ